MAEFKPIDLTQFLEAAKRADKTDKTPAPVPDGEPFDSAVDDKPRQNLTEPSSGGLGGVLSGCVGSPESKSLPAPDGRCGSVGFVGSEGEGSGEAALDRLRSLYRAGLLSGMTLELPGRPPIYDLEPYLARLGGHILTDADRRELADIAALVVRLPFLGVN